MKWVLGIPFLLLVLTTESTPTDDQQWKPTATLRDTSMQAAASIRSTQPATSSAASSSASANTTEAPVPAVPETSLRFPGAVEELSPDYYDDETYYAASGGDGPRAASDNASVAQGVRAAERQGGGDHASRGKNTAPSDGSATGESGAGASAAVEDDAPPEAVNWISWLFSWCTHWPLYGPLGEPHDPLLQAFSEAVAEHTVGIGNYSVQAEESADTDEQPSTEEPPTHFMSTAVQKVKLLRKFYKWVYYKWTSIEASGDSTFTSLYTFIDALEHPAALVESICNKSPTIHLSHNSPFSGILRSFFWTVDQHSVWVHVLRREPDSGGSSQQQHLHYTRDPWRNRTRPGCQQLTSGKFDVGSNGSSQLLLW